MNLDVSLTQTALLAKPDAISRFQEEIPEAWIEEALALTGGTATMRRRRLPANQVIWIVLGMALFRNRSIREVVDKLDLALPDSRGEPKCVASSAIPQARARLGAEPMKWLFSRSAEKWAHESAHRNRWNGLALYGVDGSTLRLPDSEENRDYFGSQSCGPDAAESGYPLVRIVALMALRSHLLAAVEFGPYATGEVTYAKQLWAQIPDNSLTIVDRGFLNAPGLIPLAAEGSGRHWLTRARNNTKYTVVNNLGPGDDLVEIEVASVARMKDPSLPKKWRVRTISYQRKGFQPQTLLTSMLDPIAFPAHEIVPLYHERWELELGYDEIKTEVLEREETVRSKTKDNVNQELWGLFLVYNLVRLEMERIAEEAHVEPTRISFVAALRYVQDEMQWCALSSPGAIPKHLQELRAQLKRFILPPRKSERSYPRELKMTRMRYPLKKKKLPR